MSAKQVAPKLLSWGSDVEPATIEQAARAAALPFVEGHVALMPDAHVGIGATIGSVIPTRGAIIPAAVGVDIGCGMIAARTSLYADQLTDLDRLMPLIEARVPAGLGKAHRAAESAPEAVGRLGLPRTELSDKQVATTVTQFGTLGSGNHFLEVCLDESDRVWVVLHSGSRGIGNQLAMRHIAEAKGLMKKFFVSLDDPDLAYFVQGTPEFDSYVADMLWAQSYAMGSRQRMMDEALRSLFEVVGAGTLDRTINCHHNFSAVEHHHGKDLWITRKGAIRARPDDEGVIPGSMGSRSYIVRGRGSAAAYDSCAHGAGRRMSRGRARRELSVGTLSERMAGKAWNADRAAALLDEHPDSYKDIDQVMADQADLVEVQHTLHQVFNYKGS